MAKNKREQLQKEYDDIILSLQKFDNAIENANHVLEYYRNNGGTPADINRAERQVRTAEANRYAYEQSSQTRRNELEADRRVKTNGRTADVINAERNGGGSATSNFRSSLASKGGGNMFVGAAAMVTELASGASDIWIAEQKKSLSTWQENQDIYLKTLETGSKIFQRHMQTFSKGMQGALTSSFASITQGVQEGAYSAASTSLDFATETASNKMEDTLDRIRLENYKQLRHAQGEKERLDLTAQQVNTGAGMFSSVASMFGPVGTAIGSVVQGIASSTTKILQANAEIEVMRLQKEIEIKEKELENVTKIKQQAMDAAKQAVSSVLEFSKAIENVSMKIDAAAKLMANTIGMSGQNVDNYEKFIFKTTRNLTFTDGQGKTRYLDKDAEDLQKMQSQYIESTGRSKEMSQKEFVESFQLGKVLGDDNLAISLMGDMDYFNKSISTSRDLIFDMFKQANKAGVSNRKFAKDLQQNLKLAQKYTFKGGVKAMMQMSIWAQKTRFNMDALEGIVDKIQDGGLEGVITQSAKLQVLGGNMAMGSDPMAMMYEAWADPEALAKRFTDMTKGIGHFNTKTGEVDIEGADAMRLKQYAEATGIDYKDARAQITQRIKGEQIDKQISKNYSDEQKALIYNKAKLGEDGKWKVNVLDKATNQMVEKDVNDLGESDWNSLMPTEESIENYVGKIYNLLEEQKGVTNWSQAVLSDETFENLKKEVNERMAENVQWVTESSTNLKKMIEESNEFVTDQNKQQHELMNATTNILNTEFEIMKKTTANLRMSFTNSGSELVNALDAVKAELDYEYAKMAYENDPSDANKKKLDEAEKKAGAANDKLTKESLKEVSEIKSGSKLTQNYYDIAEDIFDEFNSESNKGNVNDAMAKLVSTYLGGSRNVSDYKSALSTGYDDLMDALEATHHGDDNIESYQKHGMELIDGLIYYASKHTDGLDESLVKQLNAAAENINFTGKTWEERRGNTGGWSNFFKDGVISSSGKSMYTAAAEITPIQDGKVKIAKTDPSDSALFAKIGGPFDKMVNGVFGRINDVYGMAKSAYKDPIGTAKSFVKSGIDGVGSVMPWNITKNIFGGGNNDKLSVKSLDKNNGDVVRKLWSEATGTNSNQQPLQMNTVKVEISGNLNLSSNGKSINIISELEKDPTLMRSLSRMISLQVSNAMNGGRGKSNMAVGSV